FLKNIGINAALWVLASPILFGRWLFRLIGRWQFYRMAYRPRLVCRNCHGMISLVGMWRCGCQYVYKGHVLRECPICGSLPRMVRCYGCGITTKLPTP